MGSLRARSPLRHVPILAQKKQAVLQDVFQDLEDEEAALARLLRDQLGQEHIFAGWEATIGKASLLPKKQLLLRQLRCIDGSISGGLKGYLERARALLAEAAKGANPLEGWVPAVPAGHCVQPGSEHFAELEGAGLAELGSCCFVLVAGGLGERLGFSSIKVELPTELTTGTCYLELYCKQILAFQARYGQGRTLPLAIMVSDDTKEGTERLLEANGNFGMVPAGPSHRMVECNGVSEDGALATFVDVRLMREGIRHKLLEVESQAMFELERMNEAVELLRKENEQLRSILKQNDTDVNDRSAFVMNMEPAFTETVTERRTSKEKTGPVSFQRKSSRSKSILTFDIYQQSGTMQMIVKHPWFEYGTVAVVLLNAIWTAVDLDFNGKSLLESPLLFQVMEQAFVLIFVAELFVRFSALRRAQFACRDRWFLFDTLLVFLMVLENWILALILYWTRTSSETSLGALSVFRMFRMLRLARLSRLFRVFPELQTMIAGMLAGIRSVLITAVVLLAMTYVFAVILRQLGTSTSWGRDNFATVPMAIYTLLVESMLPDNGELLTRIGMDTWYCAAIYVIFLLLAAVTVMNMLIGILCDVIGEVSSEKREQQSVEFMSEKLQAILKSIDRDYDGLVSKSEFESILENEEAVKILHDVGVDVQSLVDDADAVFTKHGDTMAFEDFKEEVLLFRTTALANMRSLMFLRKFLREQMVQMNRRLQNLEVDLCRWQHQDSAASAAREACRKAKAIPESPEQEAPDTPRKLAFKL